MSDNWNLIIGVNWTKNWKMKSKTALCCIFIRALLQQNYYTKNVYNLIHFFSFSLENVKIKKTTWSRAIQKHGVAIKNIVHLSMKQNNLLIKVKCAYCDMQSETSKKNHQKNWTQNLGFWSQYLCNLGELIF